MTPALVLDRIVPALSETEGEPLTLEIAEGSVCVLFTSARAAAQVVRICVGLARPRTGSARVLGRDPQTLDNRQLRELRHSVGTCLQPIGLMNTSTVRMNVALPLIYGSATTMRDALAAADELLERFDLSEFAHLRPADVTPDAQQRVALARAVVRKPKLAVLEAPATHLSQRQLERVITLCRAETRTMLITGGELEGELAVLADTCVVWQSDVDLPV